MRSEFKPKGMFSLQRFWGTQAGWWGAGVFVEGGLSVSVVEVALTPSLGKD